MPHKKDCEFVVVGSGPGGATVARELARKGRDVTLVERGKWHNWQVGRLASLAAIHDVIRSKEGGVMARGITAGGSSVVFNGNAYDPPTWLETELGIDIKEEAAQARAETGVGPLPESFYSGWSATRRLVDAAGELDISLLPQHKFIDPEKCDPECDDCMLGCRRGAKWTARKYIEEALEHGAGVLLGSEVESVIVEQGKAAGVRLRADRGSEDVRADKVILAAGGIGTPLILLKSGIEGAGEGFFIDPMNVVMAAGKDRGTLGQMTFTFASEEFVESEGYLVGTVGAKMVFGAQLMGRSPLRALLRAPYYHRIMGMFTKIGDTPGGRVHADGTIEKPYPPEDMEKFRKGTEACKNILIRAGAKPETIMVAENIGGHPGGTAAIGRVVDKDLRALDVKDLFVCDASVFPRSPGRPPTLTIMALAKRLSGFLVS